MKEYYYYLRDNANRPVVTVCLLAENGNVARGIAVCSIKDQPEKRKGRAIAKARAEYALSRGGDWLGKSLLKLHRREAHAALATTSAMNTPWHVVAFKAWLQPHLTEFEQDLIAPRLYEFETEVVA